jgi:hypothetical protein
MNFESFNSSKPTVAGFSFCRAITRKSSAQKRDYEEVFIPRQAFFYLFLNLFSNHKFNNKSKHPTLSPRQTLRKVVQRRSEIMTASFNLVNTV